MSINRFAGFLLNWLDAKTRGQLPQAWEPMLSAGVSVDPFYDSETLDYIVLTGGGFMTVGLTQAGVMPAGFAFIPHLVCVGWVTGVAGATFTARPIIGRPGLNPAVPIGRTIVTAAGLPPGYTDGIIWEPPRVVLTPGTTFGWECTAAASTSVATAQVYGVRIPLT